MTVKLSRLYFTPETFKYYAFHVEKARDASDLKAPNLPPPVWPSDWRSAAQTRKWFLAMRVCVTVKAKPLQPRQNQGIKHTRAIVGREVCAQSALG